MISNLPVRHSPAPGVGATVTDPETGEVHAVSNADSVLLARVSEELFDLLGRVRDARAILLAELAGRMEFARERSIPAGPWTAEKEDRRTWDADAAWAALVELVAGAFVSPKEAEAAMPKRTVRKPDGRKLNALLVRVAGEDPVAASSLARARTTATSVRIRRTSVEGSVS